MDTAQVCDRLRGQETCPFHKGHKIASLCKTCGILVCLQCMMSSEHEGHTFKEITSCLREPTDNLSKHITEIEKRLLITVQKELSETKKQRTQSVQKQTKGVEQIKEQRHKAHLQIDTTADSMTVRWNEHSQNILDVLDKHILGLESLRNQLNEERKECSEILQKGSNILKYDAGLEIIKKTKTQRIPKPPKLVELEYNKCGHNFDELIWKAMGILKEVGSNESVSEQSDKYQASVSEIVRQHRYHLIESISNTSNESPRFGAIAPIGKNAAWACEVNYDGIAEEYSNWLYLLDSRRNIIQQVKLDKLDTTIFYLSSHPITGQPFYINDQDNYVKSIDTTTGKTTNLVGCEIDIHRLKVTHDNHVIVGSRGTKEAIYTYKLTGELVSKSTEDYDVDDIDHCPTTNRVAISSGEDGLTLLNSDLTLMKTYNGKNSDITTAIFNSHGDLIVGDYSKKEIFVLDGERLNFIQKLEFNGISHPGKLKLYDNILWVTCNDPVRVICARIT